MDQELQARLDEWHENNEFDRIVDAVLELPAVERDYELLGHLARAYNNVGRYDEALEQLLALADQGREDPRWFYRIGYAYYHPAVCRGGGGFCQVV